MILRHEQFQPKIFEPVLKQAPACCMTGPPGLEALVENRAYRVPFTHSKAFSMMEGMGKKLDQQLLQAFRPIAFGCY